MPTTLAELLVWLANHQTLWAQHQAEIGISEPQLEAWQTLSDQFIASHAAAEAARQASKDATVIMQDNLEAVRGYTQALIGVIRAHAATTDDTKVLGLAGLEPIQPPSQLPPPVAPDNLTATLDNNGGLRLTWKVSQPAGVTSVQYQVRRKLVGQTTWTTVGIAGSKKTFLDESIPFGTDALMYQIVPFRGDIAGAPSSQFNFQFGTGGGGMFVTGTGNGENNATKLAA